MSKENKTIDAHQQELIDKLKTLIFYAIIGWYDDSLTEYHGLDDKEFIDRVCSLTGLTETEYNKLMNHSERNNHVKHLF